ncbi:serine/threonine-protein kinase [Inmirania thermothiophila]|uniref:non-specific serine/threonine protein kinase n=1 Tax=Inmirania thermothiophila TaxID=1750597 RepID=A0A3N1Y776_9GAMM|nr:serine/threonine-protein kinase [Inmirania thermothiophila]ROR34679.1 serine/threonine-protein kinase [Inmirania thermothiophila]
MRRARRLGGEAWFAALAAGLAALVAALSPWGQALEGAVYDLAQRLRPPPTAAHTAAVLVDADTVAALGPPPWSPGVHAALLERIAAAGAAAVADLVPAAAPAPPPEARHLQRLLAELDEAALARAARALRGLGRTLEDGDGDPRLAAARRLLREGGLADGLPARLQRLARLAATAPSRGEDALAARLGGPPPLVLALTPGEAPPAAGLAAHALGGDAPLPGIGGLAPLPEALAAAVRAVGVVPPQWRRLPLGVEVGGLRLATVPLALALAADGGGPRGADPERVTLGGRPLEPVQGLVLPHWGAAASVPVISAAALLSGRPPAVLRGRAVVLGLGGLPGVAPAPTPAGRLPAAVATAAATEALLAGAWFREPPAAPTLRHGALLLALLVAVAVLPRTGVVAGWVLTVVLVNVVLDAELLLLAVRETWLPLAGAALVLLAAQTGLALHRLGAGIGGRWISEGEWSETNRMLGVALQGQGQLDLAFERLRKCRLDGETMDLLYNLALDYERKRQFAKARAVYEYMAGHDGGFRDIAERIEKTRQLESAAELGLAGAATTGGSSGPLLLDTEGVQKPMLGRYVVEEVLGRGAMGVVYRGRDPRINRIVAIKTLPLAQEFEPDELAEVKARFFREAETAGRLNHPNIVTIYDVGEEHDLAYIAMEYLEGRDLTVFTRRGRLLPPAVALHIAVKAAEALDYAHRHHVVHRDIKPGNIVFEPRSGLVKLTDFGIARITDASRTRTGTVLGTPAYMSPEQVAGQRVDGRSDLFSLGVMLYQLLTGELPFRADSMTGLMYKITHEPHRPPSRLNPRLPPCIDELLAKALAKTPQARFQSGAEMARAVRACGRRLAAASRAAAAGRNTG